MPEESIFRDGLGNRPLGLCEQEECSRVRSRQCADCMRWLCWYHIHRDYAHAYQGCRTKKEHRKAVELR